MEKESSDGESTRCAAAMLRMVLALKRDPQKPVEDLIHQVIEDTGVDASTFRRFLASHIEVMNRVVK